MRRRTRPGRTPRRRIYLQELAGKEALRERMLRE